MTTTRERREARAARLREWAEKREAKAAAAFDRSHDMASVIPFGQPILAGHHSQGRDTRYRARIAATMDQAVTHAAKADSMRSKAANIEAAADAAIYSDDPDAVEQLQAKLVRLEAERGRIKSYNATCRKGAPDESLLDDRQRAALVSIRKVGMGRDNAAFPAYATTNLSGVIATTRKRLDAMYAERLVTCEGDGCSHRFFPVDGRPDLCDDCRKVQPTTTEARWVADLDAICHELERLGAVVCEPFPHIDEEKAPEALVSLYRSMVSVGYANGWSVGA